MKTHFFIIIFLFFFFGVQAQNPLLQWSFDQEEPNSVYKNASYTEGVSGKALVFDGYTTEVSYKTNDQELLGENFTVSAWVAPQEYSWNLSAIVNQQQDFNSGFFFGIDYKGQLVGSISVSSKWEACISDNSIPLLSWSHVAMVFEKKKGISLFINGKKVGETKCSGKVDYANDTGISIGKTQTPMTPTNTERNSSRAVKSWMYFDGLMDEVKIFDTALVIEDIQKDFQAEKAATIQPLQFRQMPSGTDELRPFGAYYTKLEYAPGWDAKWHGSDLPDIIVRFDNSPVKLVFWRGTGYIPGIVTENGIWMTDQSGENFGDGECAEAMGDKQCRYSHVRIIENTPARAVIHWRYALANITHKIKHESASYPGDWMDEYWTAYPDGVIVRKQVLWSEFKNPGSYQFQETIFFNQPGTKPQDNVEYEAITFLDMEGNKASYSWENGAPKQFTQPTFKPIELVNTKSKYRPFSIHHPERITNPFSFGWVDGYSTFPCWNHWPVQQVPSDGRKAEAPDKPSHSSLTAVNGDQQKLERFDDGSIRVASLLGMTTQPIESLLPLAHSWNYPGEVILNSSVFKFNGYDKYQRNYNFENTSQKKETLDFEVTATEKSPVVNLACVIENWNANTANVEINGKNAVLGVDYRIGHIRDLVKDKLIVWINFESTSNVKVKIK